MVDVDRPVDLVMSSFCVHSDCIVVWPELIGSHKPAGSLIGDRYKDSDTRNPHSDPNSNDQAEYREKGTSGKIVNSAILAALENWGPKGPWVG